MLTYFRWSGKYTCMASVMDLKDALMEFKRRQELDEDEDDKEAWLFKEKLLTPGQWKLLTSALQLLEPFKYTMKILEAEKVLQYA